MFGAIYSLFHGGQTPIFLVTGCAYGNKKNRNFQLPRISWFEELVDVGRFIGLLLETVRNRYPFQPLRLIVHICMYIFGMYPENVRIKEDILFIACS